MDIRQCGTSGLRLSSLGLGTLTWGRDTDEAEAVDMLEAFLAAGGTTVEAAAPYGDGGATAVLGAALERVGRHRITLIGRGASRWDAGGMRWSQARGDMLSSLDDALARMGTDYVDLWLAGPDPTVPFEETIEALAAARRSGRARYTGLTHRNLWDTSAYCAWGRYGQAPPLDAVEEEFSLLAPSSPLRERALAHGFGFIGHSPLAGGVLTGKYRHSTPPDSRAASPHLQHTVRPYLSGYTSIIDALSRAADGLERSPLDVALTWARDTEGVSSLIVGPRNLRQLSQILSGGEPLPEPLRAVLDEVAYGR